MHEWRDLQFKVDLEQQIFWEAFHSNFILLSEFWPEIYWGEVAEEIFSYIHFDVWPGVWTRALLVISQHTTYQTKAT